MDPVYARPALPRRRAARRAAGILAVASVLAGPAAAQRLLVPHTSPRAQVALVDASAGALIDAAWLDVEATAEPPLSSSNILSHAERVGDEVWVAGGAWVYRYDVATRALLGAFQAGSNVRSIDPQEGRVVLTTIGQVELRGYDGAAQGTLPIFGASDTLDLFDGTMLVARRTLARVDRYTTDGQFVEVFAGPSVPTTLGVLSQPNQLARERYGHVLVCGDVRVYEFDVDGTFLDEIDAGPFEGGVSTTYSGRLVIPLSTGLALYDPATDALTTIGGPFFGQGRRVGLLDRGDPAVLAPGDPSSAMTCEGGLNSTGRRARVAAVGSAYPADRLFAIHGDRLPPGSVTMLLVARTSRPTPFAGGTLCVDRMTAVLPLPPMVAEADGTVDAALVRGPVASIAPFPGTTLHLQLLHRDGAAVRVSDAVRVTFGG